MKKALKLIGLFIVIMALTVSLMGCSQDTPEEAQDTGEQGTEVQDFEEHDIIIATGGTSGAWYPIGVGIAEVLTGVDNGISATGEVTNGGIENGRRIAKNEIAFAFVNNDAGYFALNGEGPYEEAYDVAAVASLYPSTMQIAVFADSDIHKIEDLKGKKVVVGPPASSSAIMSWNVLAEYGITENDIEGLTLSFAEGAQAMKDGHADSLIVVSAHPNSALTELALTNDIRLLQVEGQSRDSVLSKHGYYDKFVIPGGTYSTISEDINTLSLGTMLIANKSVSEELVYQFVKGLYENLDQLEGVHAMAKNIKLDHAATVPIPLHPGAERYYKEAGLID